MIKYLKEYRFYIILFLFVLIPVIAIDTSTRAPRDYRLYDRVIISVTSPIQAVISWSLEQLASGFHDYVYLWHTRRENLELTEENRRLQGTIASLRETQHENLRLRKLLSFEEQFKLDSVVARVIAKDVSTEFRAIRINRGESSGVRRNMAVVTNEGIVGRILRTTDTTADVVTILDLLSAVDAIVERSRARGVVEGMTDEACQLRYTIRTDDIQPNDVLVSSGIDGIFPKGIPVGTVSKVNKKSFGITQDVEVRPSVDFAKLEEVMIITQAQAAPISSRPIAQSGGLDNASSNKDREATRVAADSSAHSARAPGDAHEKKSKDKPKDTKLKDTKPKETKPKDKPKAKAHAAAKPVAAPAGAAPAIPATPAFAPEPVAPPPPAGGND